MSLIKGGFPARYGGRLSSVLDISMKEGNLKEFHGEGSLGVVAGKLTLEGPIVKDKTSFIVSGRRTWIDFLTRSLLQSISDGVGEAGYYFYDLNAKINHRFSDRNRLYLSAYLGDDRFGVRVASTRTEQGFTLGSQLGIGLGWGNMTSALRWNHVFNHRLFANFTFTHSRYQFDTANDFDFSRLDDRKVVRNQSYTRYTSGVRDLAAKLDFDFIPSPRHYVRYGLNVTRHRFNPGAFSISVDNTTVRLDTTLTTSQHQATEWAIYGEDDWQLSDRIKANVGVHASGFWVGGTHYASLQPRLAARYCLSDELSLKASYARMTQYIHLLTNTGVGLPTDLWVPATERIPPQQSHQIALGVARTWQNRYEISLEGYHKTMSNVIEYREGASFAGPGIDWQSLVEVGDGWSYGAEWLLQKKTGKTTGWIGYTLAWTHRQFARLNLGRVFPYRYDRRHDASLVLVHRWKENREFSLTWVYGTGNAITLPYTTYAAEETNSLLYEPFDPTTFKAEEVVHYGERNSYRMEPFHRLDVSVTFRKQTRWGQRAWILGAYNAYNRKNPYFIYYSPLGGQRRFRQFSLFPIIPSISYRFEF